MIHSHHPSIRALLAGALTAALLPSCAKPLAYEEKNGFAYIAHIIEDFGADDTLSFENGVRIAPMSLYKILEEVGSVRRFQLIQTGAAQLELRLVSDRREEAFEEAKRRLLSFFRDKGVEHLEITLSDQPPQAHPVSGKFKHIYRAE